MDPIASDRPWLLPDEKLLKDCTINAYVASGPGGQKRHKTNVAIRITHNPTRVTVTATDSRSQRENKIHAIRALRHRLAVEIRHELDPITYTPPEFLTEYPQLHMNPRNPLYPELIAHVLDLLKATHWSVGSAAVLIGTSTNAFTRFLHDDPPLWQMVNAKRQELGFKPLTWK
ncbi:MAG TPA: peptide chain release factor-like protein [Tepidisphaeraceae bacterium]|jgi:hypothetical protein